VKCGRSLTAKIDPSKADADRLCDEGLAIFLACLMEPSNVGEGDGSLLPRRREYVGDILIGCTSWCDSDVDLEEEKTERLQEQDLNTRCARFVEVCVPYFVGSHSTGRT
jgi:hypothetical protein